MATVLVMVCHSNAVMELARGVRSQLEGLIAGLAGADLTPMSLGLSHSLSRYKLKFSPDKVGADRGSPNCGPPDLVVGMQMAGQLHSGVALSLSRRTDVHAQEYSEVCVAVMAPAEQLMCAQTSI